MTEEKAIKSINLGTYEAKGKFGNLNMCRLNTDDYIILWDDEVPNFPVTVMAFRERGIGKLTYK